MQNRFQHSIRALQLGGILCLLLAAFLAPVALGQEQQADKKPKDAKEAKEKDKKSSVLGIPIPGRGKSEEEKAVEQEQKYRELRAKAKEKYQDTTKREFKLRVDGDYKEKRREHSAYAFQMNTYDQQDERVTYTGDKLKSEDTLYDNPLVQDYVNRVGQALVPDKSQQRYAFKVVLNPVPDARSLSTGTVYISTGLLSLIDNEAQLAYILGHEIAHIENNHWFDDALVTHELVDRERARDKTFKWVGLGVGVATGGLLGAKSDSAFVGVMGGAFFGGATYSLLKFISSLKVFTWDGVQEDEADATGVKLMFERNYDPREVPKLFVRLRQLAEREPRVSDGFLARVQHLNERTGFTNALMGPWVAKPNMTRGAVNLRARRAAEADDALPISPLEAGKAFGPADDAEKREKVASKTLRNLDELLRDKLAKEEIKAGGPEFEILMADLKRDNGVRAFYYDMFAMALQNLREAQQIRTDDPYAAFYYGKVMQLTARTRAEKAEAMQAFANAINLDKRGVLPGPWLHRALGLMGDRNPSQNTEIVSHLRRYVEMYQQEHSGTLPPNMDAIYAYLKTLGDDQWVARPALNVSTKNIEPLDVSGGRSPAPAPVRVAQPEPAPAKKPIK